MTVFDLQRNRIVVLDPEGLDDVRAQVRQQRPTHLLVGAKHEDLSSNARPKPFDDVAPMGSVESGKRGIDEHGQRGL